MSRIRRFTDRRVPKGVFAMIKEKYEKPFMEIIELKNDTIVTSLFCVREDACGSNNGCTEACFGIDCLSYCQNCRALSG